VQDRTRTGPVTIGELTADLIWPVAFRSVPLAIQPSRLLVAFVMIATVMGLGTLIDLIGGVTIPDPAGVAGADGEIERIGLFAGLVRFAGGGFNDLALGLLSLDFPRALDGVSTLLILGPAATFTEHWLVGGLVLLIALLVLTLGGGAIARMAICEIAGEVSLTFGEGFGFAVPRWKQLLLSVAGPLLLIAALSIGLRVFGFLLLAPAGVNVVGGLLYGLFLLAGFALALSGAALLLGGSMLVPAIAAEATDWFDAIQRAYAYVLGRTLRLLVYAATLLALGAAAYGAASWLIGATINWTAELATGWRAADAAPIAGNVPYPSFADPNLGQDLEGSRALSTKLIGVWERLAVAVLAAFCVSYFFCASSVLYLLCRRVNDEQDMTEIWMPGLIGGTLSPAAERRASRGAWAEPAAEGPSEPAEATDREG